MADMNKYTPLIIGCGYLGIRLLKRLSTMRDQVWATTRTAGKMKDIKNVGGSPLLLDISDENSWVNLEVLTEAPLEIYFLLPPSQIELASLKGFLSFMQSHSIVRLLMSSSTVVYGSSSRTVDADSEVKIDSKRAERQYSVEQCFEKFEGDSRILRLAGLYSADRIIGRESIIDGKTQSGHGESYLNLIHASDAVELLINVMSSQTAANIELACDGKPVMRVKYYSDLAMHLSCEAPEFSEKLSERGNGRQCDNQLTLQRTGWTPIITNYKEGWSQN